MSILQLKKREIAKEPQHRKLVSVKVSDTSVANDWQNSELYHGRVLLNDGHIQSMPVAERFRLLRARVERRNLSGKDDRVIAIMSAVPAEGKSFVAVNLARAFGSDPAGKTLLIDCDLRKPSVDKYFKLGRVPGLTDALISKVSLASFAFPVSRGLEVVTAGKPIEDPARFIEDPAFREQLSILRNQYKYIILDCPPVLLCPEPVKLNGIADVTLMVVRGWNTEKRLVKDAIDNVDRSKVAGIVINDGTDSSRQYRYYRYYGKSTSAEGKTAKA